MALLHSEGVGSLAHAHAMTIGMGGAESNLAIGLRRLGVPVAWVSRVGADELGTRVLREMRAEQVEVLAHVDPERPTGLMLKSHPSGGATTVRYYRSGSAASALTAEELPEQLLAGAEILHLTGITPLLSETARASVELLVQRARAAGTLISFDVNYRSALAPREVAAPLLAGLAASADIVFGGTEELALIASALEGEGAAAENATEDSTEKEALLPTVHAHGIAEVVEKRGAEGARAIAAGSVVERPGLQVDVVDTVGAGDAFVAGYLSARLEGLDLAARLDRGNECGALTCMSTGDWEGAAYREDLGRLADGGADPVSR
ncbi:ribokinase [Brachybacterium endophyticum]|uniref:Ribokinase n=2 Tax=Brachybacterium endophyticum TaxID=2182385 RepID=A0A2U2RPV6_9MICO|nr:ribokinase [Brachybacterium endophyticum]